jgi:hypothetical protein
MIKSKKMRWVGYVERMGRKEPIHAIGGKIQKEKTTRWVNNITMDLGEIRWSAMGWIVLAQDRD